VSELPKGWSTCKLDQIASIQMGQSPESKYYNSDGLGLPFFQGKTEFGERHPSVKKWCSNPMRTVDNGDILLSVRAPVGPTNIAISKSCIGRGLAGIRGKIGIDQRYLFFFLRRIEAWLSEQGTGTTFASISGDFLKSLEVSVAPHNEQTRIVEKLEELLSDLDAGVAELKAAQKKLVQYRQSLLKAAVEGTLTAPWREAQRKLNQPQETGAQLLQRILSERRARWDAKQLAKFAEQSKAQPNDWQKKYPEPVKPDVSGLPGLPEGWVWASIGQCFYVAVGATPSRKEAAYWGGNVPWVSSGEVRFSPITSTRETITEAGLNGSSTQINPIGSVLLGMIGEGKTRGQVAILKIEAANNQNCAAIWTAETPVPSEYLYFWLWSQYETTRRGSSGNNQPALNKSIIERILFPLAPVNEMQVAVSLVVESLDSILVQEGAIELAIRQATAQRKNILKAAFSGQLVPQDPNDEPASALLARIGLERAKPAIRPTKRSKKPQVSVTA
jgi:type I restriction enzyme, S subunit